MYICHMSICFTHICEDCLHVQKIYTGSCVADELTVPGQTTLNALLERSVGNGDADELDGLAIALGGAFFSQAHQDGVDIEEATKLLKFAALNMDVVGKLSKAVRKKSGSKPPAKRYEIE